MIMTDLPAKRPWITILVVLLTVLVLLPGCFRKPTPLDPREITEYQGVRLTPATSLRENSIGGVQSIDIDGYTLAIRGAVKNPLVLSYNEVLDRERYQKLVTLNCVEGWKAVIFWEGVLIRDLLDAAQPNSDAVTVIFHAHDGYTTSLPLATVQDKDLLLAHKANDNVLPERLGFPFIVVAEDKLGYKWARWVTAIELSSDADYKGFWEQRGYSNDASIK